jgi:hypothetical protein
VSQTEAESEPRTEGSPERGREDGRSNRGERPPGLGMTHSSTFRSSPTTQRRASLDYNRSRHRNDRSTQGRGTSRNGTGTATNPATITTAVRNHIAPTHTRTHGRAHDAAPTHAADPAHDRLQTHGHIHGHGTTTSTSTTTTRGARLPAPVYKQRLTLAEMRVRCLIPPDHTVPRRVGELTLDRT